MLCYLAGMEPYYLKCIKNGPFQPKTVEDMGDDVDISTLTIEQYLALIRDNIRPGVVKPEINNDIEFEINGNFMRDLRRKLFAGTDDDDAHEHVRRVLEIVDLFHFPGVTHDAIMLRVFPITLKGPALRWKKRLPVGSQKVKARMTMGKENVKDSVPHDLPVVQTYVPPMSFLGNLKGQIGSPYKTHKAVCSIGIPKEIHKMKAQEDDRDINDGRDITSKDVERIRQILTPTIHTLPNLEPMMQPYMPLGPVHDMKKVEREEEQD
ncbi:hypothetical protein Tco_0475215 [Tanacetum coccineum]